MRRGDNQLDSWIGFAEPRRLPVGSGGGGVREGGGATWRRRNNEPQQVGETNLKGFRPKRLKLLVRLGY